MKEKLFAKLWDNLRNPKLYVFIIAVFIVALVLLPYIDANVFYYKRVNNRIDILKKLEAIDVEELKNDEVLLREYNSILSEVEKQSDGSLGSVFRKETDKSVILFKFLTGGSLCWLIAIFCLFIKGFKNFGNRILGFLVFTILGGITGLLAKAIPTISNPVVNYIGFPVLLIAIIALLATSGNKKKKGTENAG